MFFFDRKPSLKSVAYNGKSSAELDFPPFSKKKKRKRKRKKERKENTFLGSCAAYFVGGQLHIIMQTVFIRCMCAGICVSVLRSNIYIMYLSKNPNISITFVYLTAP